MLSIQVDDVCCVITVVLEHVFHNMNFDELSDS